MEPALIALVDRLLDAMARRGEADLIEDYAAAIPIEVIGTLLGVPPEERGPLRGWSLVLQMTYGSKDNAYFSTVKEAADAMPCHTLVLSEFMDGTESAYLRLAADVFVLAIPSNAFSASLQEYLYAGARVLRAKWLRYPQLEELGISTTEFSELSQVPALLTQALAHELSAEEVEKRAMLKVKYSWDTVREGWLALYR